MARQIRPGQLQENALYDISSSYAVTASFALNGGGGGNTFPYTGSAEITGSLNVIGEFTASGLNYPILDGDEKQIISTDSQGRLSFDWADRTNIDVKNTSGATLTIGTPIYITGYQGASVFQIAAASASDSNKMPAVGVLSQTLNPNDQGYATLLGALRGYDTQTYSTNDSLYVCEGILTSSRPTGSSLIQKIARVGNIASNGEITILGAGRTNDIPNITSGYIWVGNNDSIATAVATSSIQNVISSSYALQALTASYAVSASHEIVKEVSSSYADTASFAQSGDGIFSGSFSGSFQGDGSGLTNIPASGITGLNLSRIASGSATASISPDNGLQINTDTQITGSLNVSGSTSDILSVGSKDNPHFAVGVDGNNRINLTIAADPNDDPDKFYISYQAGDSNTAELALGGTEVQIGDVEGQRSNTYMIIDSVGQSFTFVGSSPITASSHFSSSASSTASFGTYIGDGSQLSGISTTPFPFIGDAVITGSLILSGSSPLLSLPDAPRAAMVISGSNDRTRLHIYDTEDNPSPTYTEGAGIVLTGGEGAAQAILEMSAVGSTNGGSNNEQTFIRSSEMLTITGNSAAAGDNIKLLGSSNYGLRLDAGSSAVSLQFITNGGSTVSTLELGNGTYTKANASGTYYKIGRSSTDWLNLGSTLATFNGHVSSNATSTASFGTYIGDGSQLIGVLTTASVSLNTITFTKGDGSTFPITVDTGSGGGVPSGTVSSSAQITELGFVTSSATASFVLNSQTSSMSVATASYVETAQTASYVLQAVSASFATSASYAPSVDVFPFVGDAVITGSLTITGSFNAFKLNTNNVILGPDAATSLGSGGVNNVVLGNSAASNLTTGDNNVIIGTNAGDGVGIGGSNVAIGRNAGFSALGNRSVLVGDQAGTEGGTDNVFLGYQAGAVGTGNYNVAIGTTALRGNSGGSNYNIAIGYESGYRVGAGDENILIGRNSGDLIVTGNANIIIGSGSLGASALERQLRIGHADTIVISGSLDTGDIIFSSTASAEYLSTPAGNLSSISASYALTASHALNAGGGTPTFIASGSTSASAAPDTGVVVEHSGSTAFSVIGDVGTLFSVDDDLNGMLFTANDISGFPVLQASASGEVYVGKTPQSLYTTAVISSTTAATTHSLCTLSTSSYDGAFFEYTAQSASNARAGSIMSTWNGSNIVYAETTTTDIGVTSDLTTEVIISGSTARLVAYGANAGYKIKTIIKAI